MNADQLKQVENLCDIVFTKGRGTAEDKTRAQQQLSGASRALVVVVVEHRTCLMCTHTLATPQC